MTDGIIKYIIHECHRYQREHNNNRLRGTVWVNWEKRCKHANTCRTDVSNNRVIFVSDLFFIIIYYFIIQKRDRRRRAIDNLIENGIGCLENFVQTSSKGSRLITNITVQRYQKLIRKILAKEKSSFVTLIGDHRL